MRSVLLYILACLVGIQGMAVGALAAKGPAHTHGATAAANFVLYDFRRAGSMRRAASEKHFAIVIGHFHQVDAPMRHHHTRHDVTVVRSGAEMQPDAFDDRTISPSLAALVALPCGEPATQRALVADALPMQTGWAMLTHDPEPFERPPRSA
jgi:hypothetical protein